MAYNWALIKREYVQGYKDNTHPTLEQLCERHGCSDSSIRKKSAEEKWTQERNIYCTKIEQKIKEKKIETLAEEAANIDNKALTIAEKGLNKANKRLDENLTDAELLKNSNAATNYHKMGKLALGEPTERTESKVGLDLNELPSDVRAELGRIAYRLQDNDAGKSGET